MRSQRAMILESIFLSLFAVRCEHATNCKQNENDCDIHIPWVHIYKDIVCLLLPPFPIAWDVNMIVAAASPVYPRTVAPGIGGQQVGRKQGLCDWWYRSIYHDTKCHHDVFHKRPIKFYCIYATSYMIFLWQQNGNSLNNELYKH